MGDAYLDSLCRDLMGLRSPSGERAMNEWPPLHYGPANPQRGYAFSDDIGSGKHIRLAPLTVNVTDILVAASADGIVADTSGSTSSCAFIG